MVCIICQYFGMDVIWSKQYWFAKALNSFYVKCAPLLDVMLLALVKVTLTDADIDMYCLHLCYILSNYMHMSCIYPHSCGVLLVVYSMPIDYIHNL